jgi:hypothetical protein
MSNDAWCEVAALLGERAVPPIERELRQQRRLSL